MGRIYKKSFEENKWKQIILDLNEIFKFIEENKEKLQKAYNSTSRPSRKACWSEESKYCRFLF